MRGIRNWKSLLPAASLVVAMASPLPALVTQAAQPDPVYMPMDDGPVIASMTVIPAPSLNGDGKTQVVIWLSLMSRQNADRHLVSLQRISFDSGTQQWQDDPGASQPQLLLGSCVHDNSNDLVCQVGEHPSMVMLAYETDKPDGAIYAVIDGRMVIGAGATETPRNSKAAQGLIGDFFAEAHLRDVLRSYPFTSLVTSAPAVEDADPPSLAG